MKINLPLLIFLLIHYVLIGQQHLPLKFKGDAVKWSELQWMEGNRKEDQRFEYRVPPIVVDDTIYLFNNFQGLFDNNISAGFNGYTIKKMNKNTGEKYWEVQREYKEYLKRKAISQPAMQDGQLIVTLFDEAPPRFGPGTDWNRCYPAHIVIDRETGIVVDSNYVDRDTPELPYFDVSIDPNNERSSKFYLQDSVYVNRFFGFERNMIDIKIDLKGNIIQSDSVKITWNYNTRHVRHYNLNNEFVYFIILTDSANFTKKEFLFNKYDHDLNLLKSVDFAESIDLPDPVTFITSFPVSSEYFVIGINSQVANPLKYESRYFLFDESAILIDKIFFTINGDPNIEYGWHRPLVDVVNKKLLLTRSQQDAIGQNTKFDIFIANGTTIKSIKQVEVEGTTDHFRTTYHQMLDNGDILLFIDQFDWADQNIRWFSWILLDGAKMGIISNTKDEELANNTLKLHPNPTSGIVSIGPLDSPATITISNMEGQKMKQLSNISNEVNISDLPAGMYIFDIRNKEINERHKIVKVE